MQASSPLSLQQKRAPHLLGNEVRLLLLIRAAYELQAVCCALLHRVTSLSFPGPGTALWRRKRCVTGTLQRINCRPLLCMLWASS